MRDIYTAILRFDELHYDGTPPGVMISQLGMIERGCAVPLTQGSAPVAYCEPRQLHHEGNLA